MKVHVDHNKCVGHAVCEGLAADVFRIGDDGFSHVLVTEVEFSRREMLVFAVSECPTGAISFEG